MMSSADEYRTYEIGSYKCAMQIKLIVFDIFPNCKIKEIKNYSFSKGMQKAYLPKEAKSSII
jgi:hypothetical protein